MSTTERKCMSFEFHRFRFFRALLPLFAVLIAAGCPGNRHNDPDAGKRPKPGSSQAPAALNVILRMHGSNTIGAELAPAMAEEFLRTQGATQVKRIPGKPDEVVIQGIFPDSSVKSIEIAAHGSATAFNDLRSNQCDIGNSSRQIKPEEVASLSNLGDMLSPASEHVLGMDGVAVIVNFSNSVKALSKEQLRDIFAGQLTDWRQAGRAKTGPFHIYARDEKSGTWDTFKTLVLGSTPLAPSAKRFEDSRQLSDSVANDPDGIGFIGLPYVRSAKALGVSEGGTEPVFPNRLTVSTEDYPLSRRLYMYTASIQQNQFSRDFITFAISKAGQDLVSQNGFLGQNIEIVSQPTPPSPHAPPDYRRLTAGSIRLPLDFRFRSGSSALDNKALFDLPRVVDFVSNQQFARQKIMLLGFADSSGDPRKNCDLSTDRARAVDQEFSQHGIRTASVTGLCSEVPVASNATPEGRERNRRVEVWLSR